MKRTNHNRITVILSGLLAAVMIFAVSVSQVMAEPNAPGSTASNEIQDEHDDRPDDANDRPGDVTNEVTAETLSFPTDEVKKWATSYGFDLDAFMFPTDPTTIAPHEPTDEDIELFRQWITFGGNPRNQVMKAVNEAVGETVANQLWNYLSTAFWSPFMNKANVGSVVSKTSGLKNVGAVQEGQFAAYFGSYFADLISGRSGDTPNSGNTTEAYNSATSDGYQYSAAVTLISHGFVVSSDATTWRLHNAADGSVVYEIAAADVKQGDSQAFTVIVSEGGETYWQAGVDSAEKLMKLFDLSGDGYLTVSVIPDSGKTYPYLYPDLAWELTVGGDKPSWYGQTHEDAIMAAFEEWKAFVYDFDLDGFLNYFANLPAEPVQPTATDIALLKDWAIFNSKSTDSGTKFADENYPWVGQSIWNDVAQYLNDTFGDTYGQCPGPTVCHGIEVYLGITLDSATEDYIGSSVGEKEFVGSFFTNTTRWQLTGSEVYPYQACADLWMRGFIPSFDGTTWRLSSGKNGTVVYEIAAEDLTSPMARPTSSTVLVDGKAVAFDAYNINDNNYFKLRDIAYILSGTEKQFDVSWDGLANAITLTSGKQYTVMGGEMVGKGDGNKTATLTAAKIYLNNEAISLTAYNIDDNNYFKLVDTAAAFNFSVTWDGENNTIAVETAKGYNP